MHTLSEQTRQIVTASIPALEAHGLDITHEMYRRLMHEDSIWTLFNQTHQKDGEQQKALAYAVLAYARHIENPAPLKAMIERIAEKHVGLNILPEHYPYVGRALLGAIAHVLGEAATPEIMGAWEEAYNFLASVFINREAEIYHDHEHQPGGWTGWRRFRLARKQQESENITSFILEPEDGKPVMRHRPGQYLSFRLHPSGHEEQRRNYSISSAPASDHYRITVKKEDKGLISSWLHHDVVDGDVLEVSAPAGDFYLEEKDAPIVLLSAGVGLTPMISMAGALASGQNKAREIHYIHTTQTPKTEAFGPFISELARKNHLKADIFYSRAETKPDSGKNITRHCGRLAEDWINQAVPSNAMIYLCGPDKFTLKMFETLKNSGHPKENIRYEFFGSAAVAELVV